MTDCFAMPNVAAWRLERAKYPLLPPFHPSTAYPEYPLESLGQENLVYEGVRELFYSLGLDQAAYGTPAWNPLGALVHPGDRVVLKPNLIWHAHRYNQHEFEQIITHGSIIRAVLDYVLIALQGRGEIWVADGPQLDADWKVISLAYRRRAKECHPDHHGGDDAQMIAANQAYSVLRRYYGK